MKRIIAVLLSLLASTAFSATLSPITLLNPSGSSSGQAIVSTGSSSAPAWGNVTATALAAQAANTVVANVTASSASPTAFAMPSCSTAASALQYTSGSGFTCLALLTAGNPAVFSTLTATGQTSLGGSAGAESLRVLSTASAVNRVQLNGAATGTSPLIQAAGSDTNISLIITSQGTGNVAFYTGAGARQQVSVLDTASANRTLTLTGSNGGNPTIGTTAGNVGFSSTIVPTSTLGIAGTTTNDSPATGSIGESNAPGTTASAVATTSATPTNVTSVSLTAGDYLVWGMVSTNPAAGTVTSGFLAGVSTTSAGYTSIGGVTNVGALNFTTSAGQGLSQQTPMYHLKLSTTSTVYLVTTVTYSTSTLTTSGILNWIRIR